ncbi:M16 family metallopeptidase [Streptomyces sp. NBC_00239]|uniref:M16 family metallopeptidase n=1 Tax=Streptomyces sp. NBC_00239 TaxID=2903640 RepID=UPI002E2B7E26|nr:insulinase family protein [Streptomyces sp. NBC_00239]
MTTSAPAGPLPVPSPHFTPPAVRESVLEGGTLVGIDRAGAGDLAEARLVVPLTPAGPAHATEVDVAADVLKGVLGEAVGRLAVVRAEARPDRLVVSVRAFAGDLAEVCTSVGAALEAPDLFGDERVARAAGTVRDRAAATAALPAVVARTGFLSAVYGTHPYGRTATAADAGEVTGERLAALLGSAPASARRGVVVGRGPVEELLAAAAPLLPRPSARAPRTAYPPADRPGGGAATVLAPGAPQALIRLGGQVPGRTHADYPALQLAVLMLGGWFGSRLTLVLREREGLSYAPRAVLDPLGSTAAFTLEADVRTDGAARALVLIDEELERLAAGAFAPRELLSAQNFAVGSMAMSCSSRSGLASVFAGTLASGLPARWLGGYEPRVRALSPADVARAARTYLQEPGLTGVVVTPGAPDGLPPVRP